jgi:murein DD-endopeptidase MepM/ murein hydrolase activator NlpD
MPARRVGARGAPLLLALATMACQEPLSPTGPAVAPALACSGYGRQSESPYVLPYPPGLAYRVLQGNCGPYTHWPGDVFKYGYDFHMAIATPVHAARPGIVLAIEERYPDGNGTPGRENFVFVRHADGTIARYFHLTEQGALVGAGDSVEAGALIGLSGNTGRTNGVPHLHFDVAECPPTSCRTLPLLFRNTAPHPRGLLEGESYAAQ